MPKRWFIFTTEDTRLGPFTAQQLRELAQDRLLLPDGLVWCEGLDRPVRARRIKGLFQSANAVARTQPTPSGNEQPPSTNADEQLRRYDSSNKAIVEPEQRSDEFSDTRAGTLKHRLMQLSSAVGHAKQLMADAIKEANRSIDESEQISLRDKLVFGRSSKYCDWLIPHPTVELRHFEILLKGNVISVRDFGTQTGTFVNGTRIPPKEAQKISNGDTVAAGPYVFQFNGFVLRMISKGQHSHVVCMNLSKDVLSDRGETIRILNGVTLEILPGEFVILLGPSGSGKSTLMNALSGRSLATSGDVLLNEQNLYTNFDALKKRMAIVPQRDLLHERLSLKSALRYTAELRLPPDITSNEKNEFISTVINQVEMNEKANVPISTYSGGQIKRASLAIELLSNPSLLFIDEATSGLDEHSDKEIMNMLRKLADDGKTIICITHNIGNVVECAHTIVVMASGGYLAYAGSPDETLQYFSISDLGQLYQRLKDRPGAEWAAVFSRTQRYADMAEAAGKRSGIAGRPDVQREVVTPLQKAGVCFRHARTTAKRNIAVQLRDRRALLVAAVQPLLVGFLIVILFGAVKGVSSELQDGLHILFLLGISSFWLGCNNAAKEIVKERAIFQKERNAGLDAAGYLVSKFCLLALFTAAQSMLLLSIVEVGTRLDGSLLSYSTSMLFTGMCGVSLGLAISAMSSDTDVAATAVPLAIIPQVILAGAIKPVAGLSQWISAGLSPCYWCFGMLSKSLTNSLNWHLKDPMWSQNSFVVDLFVLLIFASVFMSISLSRLLGIKITELAKRAELELWIKSIAELNRSASTRSRSNLSK